MEGEAKSLDDFFAKKDKGKKGKSKTKAKFTTSSITKQVENSQKTVNEVSGKEQKPFVSQSTKSQNEDEWEDFNEPKEKDYSGLKVQSFQTLEKQDDNVDERAEWGDEYGNEDTSEKAEMSSGVWQAVHGQQTAQVAPAEEPKEEVKKEPVKGAYIPPSMRSRTIGQSDVKADQSWKYGSNRSARIDPRRPPEISSEIAFPSLQASASDVPSKSQALSTLNFEPVKHGARASNVEQSMNRRMNIDLENKYDALSK